VGEVQVVEGEEKEVMEEGERVDVVVDLQCSMVQSISV
jgi:hypothetical protein